MPRTEAQRGVCAIEDCEKVDYLVRGWCAKHYRRFRVHGDPLKVWVNRKPCQVEGCEGASAALDYCTKHYQAFKTHGDPNYKAPTNLELGLVPHGTPHGYNYYKCRCEQCLAWQRPYAREQMLKKYGITSKDFDRMFEEQGGVCAICFRASATTLHVDHCHSTGVVRGLLCRRCNTGVGQFEDDPDRLMAAAAYLLAQVDVLGLMSK